MSIKGLRGITINTSWEGITLAGISPLIDKMKEIGFNLIKVDIPITEIRAITAFKAMLQKAHSLDIKIHLFMNISRYAGSFNTFHTNAAARSAFMSDLDFVILNYPDLDGIELEEPYLHYVPADPAISLSARTFFNAFFSEIRTKLNNRIGNGFDYGFNNATESLASNLAMGLDVNYIASNNIFTFYDDQNSNTDLAAFKSQVALYRSRYPNLEIMEVIYLTTSTLLKNTYPGGRCSAKAPGTMSPSYANAACWNQFVYDQIEYLKENNISFCVFTSHYLNVSGTYWINGIASNTPAVLIKAILGTQPIPTDKQYVLKFRDDFNSSLSGWDIIWKNPSVFKVANSILTIDIPAGSTTPAWMRKTGFTWKYGKLSFRAKFPNATGSHAGVWAYKNNGVPCSNNPAWQSQDSVNIETNISKDTYGPRIAGHLTTNYSIWSAAICNQYMLQDTPYDGNNFHEYEIEWTPVAVVFKKDGVEMKRYTKGIPTQALDLNAGIDCVGSNGSACAGIQWMDKTPSYPMKMEIDWIQLEQLEEVIGTGSIDIQSNPTGAEVYFNNYLKGITPLILDNITPGTHVVELRKTGYNNLEQSVVITAGQTLTKMFTLQYSCVPDWQCELVNGLKTGYEVDGCGNRRENSECIPKGMLYISTIPVSGAKIYLDNEDTLSFTPAILPVSPGIPHTIRVFVPGYNEFIESNIIVSDNQTISKIYTLLSSSRDSAGTVITVSTGLVVGTTLYGISKLLQR